MTSSNRGSQTCASRPGPQLNTPPWRNGRRKGLKSVLTSDWVRSPGRCGFESHRGHVSTAVIDFVTEHARELQVRQQFAGGRGPLVEPLIVAPWLLHRRTAAAEFIRGVDLLLLCARYGFEVDRAFHVTMHRLRKEIWR